jgi:hypothetical protein
MVPDYATAYDARHGVVAHRMAHEAAYRSALDAAFCVSSACACQQKPGQGDSNHFLVHF